VRRAYLCGEDPVSGRSFEHRKGWIRSRLVELAGVFGVEVCGYAVMSNHLHVILRIRPDVAATWSDDEVLRTARTIADLDQSEAIEPMRLNEAINYRILDRNLWT
jgi:hypothetical protein